MKKTYILFCIIVFSLTQVFSQNATIDILNDQSLSLEDIFDLIKSKTDYQFVYRGDLIKDAPVIQVKKGAITVKDLLKKGLDTISCTYEFKDNNTIILSRKNSIKNSDNKATIVHNTITINARILDRATKQPIVYANIGFIKKGIGTISNEDGFFKLEYNEASISQSETLQISTLGYQTLKIKVSQLFKLLAQSNIIYLNPKPFDLDEVFLTNEKRKEIRLGNTRANKGVVGYWKDKKALGGEIATKMEVRKKNTKLLDLKFNIVENLSDSLKIRVNVYDYAKRYPTKKLLTQNIFYTIKQKEGEATIDLRPYNISVDNDFVIGIELVKVYGDIIDFSISAEPYAGIAFKRYISQDKWERFDLTGMNFSVLTSVPDTSKKRVETEEIVTSETIETIARHANQIITQKIVKGKITHLGAPIKDVNISIKGSNKGTKTDANGNYSLQVEVGDVIRYSHVSFKTITIIVEDVTYIINLDMPEKINQLDEAVVTARKKKKSINLTRAEKALIPFNSAVGEIDPSTSSFSIGFLDKTDINTNALNLNSALAGRSSGLRLIGDVLFLKPSPPYPPPAWDIDGQIFSDYPDFFDPSLIETVHILKTASTKYGTIAEGGVIIINTQPNTKGINKVIQEKYTNQNYYQDDAKPISNALQTTNDVNKNNELPSTDLKDVYGTITTDLIPLENVNIKVIGSSKGTVTDAKGNYKLNVRIGDELQFSYQGLHKVNIIIEDITVELNIDMVSRANSLDEVVVIAKNVKGEVIKRAEKAERTFKTSRGEFDPKKLGYAIGYIDGEKVNFALYSTLRQALVGKVAGLSVDKETQKVYLRGKNYSIEQDYPAAWEVDGNFTTEEPVGIDLNNIKDIRFLKGVAATNKYGTLGAGGVIAITTNMSNNATSKTTGIDQKFTNNNFYANDATLINENEFGTSQAISVLKEYKNRAFAFNFYKETMQNKIDEYHIHLDIAKLFAFYFKDTYKASQILKKMVKKHENNPEILKAIAYQFETIEAKRDAVKTYEAIFKLRPNYAQSYRDLANAYVENDQFKKAWRLYMSYLSQGYSAADEGIGQIIYNEMEYLYFNRKNQTKIKETFKPKSENLFDFRNDIRLVFEWHTSEAEFDLEFVSPDKRSYIFNHSLQDNQDLITDEKLRGYSSKDFIIDDIGIGEWLINITYKGNKKPEPTYFKITTYYHWGKPNQKKKISVFSFKNQRDKIQLAKINKQSLLTSK